MLRHVCLSILGVALLIAPAATQAQPNMSRYYSQAFRRCMGAAGEGGRSTVVDGGKCYGDEAKRWDDSLNAIYQRVMAGLSPERQLGLRADERAWLEREKADCDRQLRSEAPTDMTLSIGGRCQLDYTIDRVLYLSTFR